MENNDSNTVKVNLQNVADKQNAEQDVVHKVDFSKLTQEEDTVEDLLDDVLDEPLKQETDGEELQLQEQEEIISEENDQEDRQEVVGQDESQEILEEITDEEVDELQQELDEAVEAAEDSGKALPENIQKLVDFMNETGGSIEDYAKLNTDVSKLSEDQLLREFHASQEPDLTADEIDFLIEDLYSTDEYEDDDRAAKKKTIAKKRAISQAKSHFEEQKEKYYREIKAGSKLTPDQKKAVDFFNRYNKEQEGKSELQQKKAQVFKQKTDNVFNEKFKGFEFKVGEKRYRYNVKDAGSVKQSQSNLENFTKKFLGDDNTLSDAKGYHKALFTAMNADAIAEHFYNQGKADAIKNSDSVKKNINMDPRKNHGSNTAPSSGFRARVVESDSNRPGRLTIKK